MIGNQSREKLFFLYLTLQDFPFYNMYRPIPQRICQQISRIVKTLYRKFSFSGYQKKVIKSLFFSFYMSQRPPGCLKKQQSPRQADQKISASFSAGHTKGQYASQQNICHISNGPLT